MRVLVTTASFGRPLNSTWVNQKSGKYEIVFNRIDDSKETSRHKAMTGRLRGKIPKMLAWEDHPDYDYYIWIDGDFSIPDPLSIERMVDECIGKDACFFKHSERNCVKDEIEIILDNIRHPYIVERYEGELMGKQVENYTKDTTWNDNILFECGAFIYSNRIVANRDSNVMKEWFYHNCIWSVQDQLSLPYALHKFGINYKLLEGNVWFNKFIKYDGEHIIQRTH